MSAPLRSRRSRCSEQLVEGVVDRSGDGAEAAVQLGEQLQRLCEMEGLGRVVPALVGDLGRGAQESDEQGFAALEPAGVP